MLRLSSKDRVEILLDHQRRVLEAEERTLENQRLENELLMKQLRNRQLRAHARKTKKQSGRAGQNGRLYCPCRFGTVSQNVFAVHKSRCHFWRSQKNTRTTDTSRSGLSTGRSAKHKSHEPTRSSQTPSNSSSIQTTFLQKQTKQHPVPKNGTYGGFQRFSKPLAPKSSKTLVSRIDLLDENSNLCSRVFCTDQVEGLSHCWIAVTREQYAKYGFCWKCRWCDKTCTYSTPTPGAVVLPNQEWETQCQVARSAPAKDRWGEMDDPSASQKPNTAKLIICTLKTGDVGAKSIISKNGVIPTDSAHGKFQMSSLTDEQKVSVLRSCYPSVNEKTGREILASSGMDVVVALSTLKSLETYPKMMF